MRQVAQRVATAAAWREDSSELPYRILGLMLVSLFPAVFWTGLVAVVGSALGHTMNPAALMTFGLAIAAFCAAIGQVFLSRN